MSQSSLCILAVPPPGYCKKMNPVLARTRTAALEETPSCVVSVAVMTIPCHVKFPGQHFPTKPPTIPHVFYHIKCLELRALLGLFFFLPQQILIKKITLKVLTSFSICALLPSRAQFQDALDHKVIHIKKASTYPCD